MGVWLAVGCLAMAQGRPDVIEYYWLHAAKSWHANKIELTARTVSCQAWAVSEELSRGGIVKSADTSVNRYYFSAGKTDSIVHISGDKRLTIEVDLSIPDIFDSTYLKTFYPNDTGAGELAIGFDTDTPDDQRPTGIVTIDRDSHLFRRLHLSWPHKPGFRRYGRSFHFVETAGLIVPDTIIETAVIERLLADEDYRLKIILSDYTISSPVDTIKR